MSIECACLLLGGVADLVGRRYYHKRRAAGATGPGMLAMRASLVWLAVCMALEAAHKWGMAQ